MGELKTTSSAKWLSTASRSCAFHASSHCPANCQARSLSIRVAYRSGPGRSYLSRHYCPMATWMILTMTRIMAMAR